MSVTKILLLAFVGLVAVIWAHLAFLKVRFYRATIPDQLELTYGLPTTGSNGSIWDIKACGGAIFNLTQQAALTIEQQGLEAVKNAVQGRGYLDSDHPEFHNHTYSSWRETPLPREWTSEGSWAGLHCIGLSASDAGSIISAAKAPGSYFTTRQPRTLLLVIPKHRLVIFTYFD